MLFQSTDIMYVPLKVEQLYRNMLWKQKVLPDATRGFKQNKNRIIR